jgi:hypothetical protein
MLRKTVLTRGDASRFAAALRALLTQPSFRAAARLASERLQAVRVPYRVQAADWVEYAAALRNHSSFLHTQGQKMARWQVACLDLVALGLLLAAAPLVWAYRVWSAGRGGGQGPDAEDDLVQVQLMLPPSQQAAAKQLQIAQHQEQLRCAAGGEGRSGGAAGCCGYQCHQQCGEHSAAAAAEEQQRKQGRKQQLHQRRPQALQEHPGSQSRHLHSAEAAAKPLAKKHT